MIVEKFKVAVLIACHNRVNQTEKALESLRKACPPSWHLDIYAVDDGSIDGTSDLIKKIFPAAQITTGTGNWYWARSMATAEKSIDKVHDAILWLNDDVTLRENSLVIFEELRKVYKRSILIGQTSAPHAEIITYGGLVKVGRRPFKFKLNYYKDQVSDVDSFNGNVVLVPKEVELKLQGIDGGFAHAYADIDYGLRAKKAGFKLLVVPSFIGVCEANSNAYPKTIIKRIVAIHQPKGQPFRSQIRYLRRHGHVEWPIYLLSPYIRALFKR